MGKKKTEVHSDGGNKGFEKIYVDFTEELPVVHGDCGAKSKEEALRNLLGSHGRLYFSQNQKKGT